jgi:molybdate transport system regulatory protein
MAEPQLRILLGAVVAIGPGKAALLEAIERSGSIAAAAREMGMSYRRAWVLIDAMNGAFTEPVVTTARGGSGGGGAALTESGRRVLARYRAMERKASRALAPDLARFREDLRDEPGGGSTANNDSRFE